MLLPLLLLLLLLLLLRFAAIAFLSPLHQAVYRLHIFMLPTIFGKLFMDGNCLPDAQMQYAGQDLQEQGTLSPVLDE